MAILTTATSRFHRARRRRAQKSGMASGRRSRIEHLEARQLLFGDGGLFDDATAASGVGSSPLSDFEVSWIDFNSDGYADLWLGTHVEEQRYPKLHPRLFLNQRDGTFRDIGPGLFEEPTIFDKHGSVWVDFDNDGDPDLIQTVGGGMGFTLPGDGGVSGEDQDAGQNGYNRFFVNQNGVLLETARQAGLDLVLGRGRDVTVTDWDLDGLLDALIVNGDRFDGCAPTALLAQTADGFANVTALAHLTLSPPATETQQWFHQAMQFGDLNGDGLPDLIYTDGRAGASSMEFYAAAPRGQPREFIRDDAFLGVSGDPGLVMGWVLADFNGDLHNDLFVPTLGGASDRLLLYDPALGRMVDATAAANLRPTTSSSNAVAGDFDNDGDVDLYVSCESPWTDAAPTDLDDVLYLNNGDGTFQDVPGWPGGGATAHDLFVARKVAVADYDNDGFLDLYLGDAGSSASDPRHLFHNAGNANHWLELDLEGVQSNRDGIGAKIIVTAGGVSQMREVTDGKQFLTQNAHRVHVGLGASTFVESVVIAWPSGETTELRSVGADRILKVVEPSRNNLAEARSISVALNAGDYSGSLRPVRATDVFRFELTRPSRVSARLAAEGASVAIVGPRGMTLASAERDVSMDLQPGAYYFRVSALDRTATTPFVLTPIVTSLGDLEGPLTSELAIDVEIDDPLTPTIRAIVSDGCRGNGVVDAAEYTIDSTDPNAGVAMQPDWEGGDHVVQSMWAHIPVETYQSLAVGEHVIYVRGRDAAGNWGAFASMRFAKQDTAALTITLSPEPVVFEAGEKAILDGTATLTLPGSTNLDGAVLTVRFADNVDGRLSILSQRPGPGRLSRHARDLFFGGEDLKIGDWWHVLNTDSGAPLSRLLVVRFNDHATVAAVQAVLRAIRYGVESESPAPSSKVVEYFLAAGGVGSNVATKTVEIHTAGFPTAVIDFDGNGSIDGADVLLWQRQSVVPVAEFAARDAAFATADMGVAAWLASSGAGDSTATWNSAGLGKLARGRRAPFHP